jgi:hypothetical protein
MLAIILFAIIGVKINAGAGYWIVFGAFCVWKLIRIIVDLCNN